MIKKKIETNGNEKGAKKEREKTEEKKGGINGVTNK